MNAAARTTALRRYLPDPTRLWIRCCPVSWPGGNGLWCHLSEKRLGGGRPGAVPDIDPHSADDLLYLPPVEPALDPERRRLVRRLERASVPVLSQRSGRGEASGPHDVTDLLAPWLEGGVAAVRAAAAPGRTAVWPLVPGLTDDPGDWEAVLGALAEEGVEVVVPLSLELDPGDRRRLAEFTDDAGYHALFHGSRPDERAFSRAAARLGIDSFAPRPELAGPPRTRFARGVAAQLAHAAELWLRLGRPEAAGQDLLRASRWTDRCTQDLQALAREGNLDVLPWLDSQSRGVVDDLAAGRSSELLRELEQEYLAP